MRVKLLLALATLLAALVAGCGEGPSDQSIREHMPEKYRAVEEASQTLCEEEALRDPGNITAEEATQAMEDCR